MFRSHTSLYLKCVVAYFTYLTISQYYAHITPFLLKICKFYVYLNRFPGPETGLIYIYVYLFIYN